MTGRLRALGLFAGFVVAAGTGGLPASAADPDAKSDPPGTMAGDAHPPPLTVPGATTAYDCDTEAFGMDFTPFKKTDGTIRLSLEANIVDAAQSAQPTAPAGTWQVSGPADDRHVASIAKLVGASCSKGCPFTLSPKGEAMLWAPQPKSLEKLGEKETLTIAVIKPDPLSVSISTFRGRDVVALEKGACRKTHESDP